MGRCILHIGMYKTGTTSIQRSLHPLANDQFAYADINGHPNHSRAVFGVVGFDHPEAPALSHTEKQEAIARFRRSMSAARDRTFLISGEGIVLLPPEYLKSLRELLREVFDQITVAAAVREPAGFMASAFQTRVKRLTRENNLRHLYRYRSYRALFGKFDEIFGRENVRLWKFEPGSYPGGCAVRDFCGRLGIAIDENRIVRFNDSLSREALGLLFTYRKLGTMLGSTTMTGPENERLAQALMPIGRTRFRFSPDVINPILNKNRDDIEWMEARLGQSLHEDLGSHLPGDVRVESDFLEPDPDAVSELLDLLGDAAPPGNRGETPDEVAGLVHALRMETAPPVESPFKRLTGLLLKRAKAALTK